jgi:hypothetical protein
VKKLLLVVMLAAAFGLSFVSCSGVSKSEDTSTEKNNTGGSAQQEEETANLGAENVQETGKQA